MILQDPVQAAIWHCLNNYDYKDAIFLSERLYAEVKTDEALYLLATSYYRNGQKKHAYNILKDKTNTSSQCRYLFGMCAYDLEKYAEAESTLLENHSPTSSLEDITAEYDDQTPFTLLLLGKIAAKTERKQRAIDAWRKALKLNPFLWSCFEYLCKIGEKPNPQTIFRVNESNFSMCQGSSINNVDSILCTINSNTPGQDKQEPHFNTPQQILVTSNPNKNTNMYNSKMFTPDESPLAAPLCLSGFETLPSSRIKPIRIRRDSNPVMSPQPTFGHLFEQSNEYSSTPNIISQPTLTESNTHNNQSLAKRMRAHMDQLRKDTLLHLRECKPVFNQSTNLSVAKTPTIPLSIQPSQNVRRSSRLFSNSNYSVKENNKSPSRSKFATPKSPSRKTKQRIAKVNLNKNNAYTELNTRNKMEKERSETITSTDSREKNTVTNTNVAESFAQKILLMQKQSTEAVMYLLRNIGQAYLDLSNFHCKAAVEGFSMLPENHVNTYWLKCMLGLAHFEMNDYESSIKYFGQVHSLEPYRIEYMDVYSTALWHLQKEVALSGLTQDVVALDKTSPVTWCVSGNCFSLHKEHDAAIKFFQRAIQVDPQFPYAYTLLGHEYITTEELDKAMSCFRNAIRLDPRHYNAWFGIGTIYSKQERYHLAEMNYTRALSINRQSSVILCHIGVVQHALKEIDKALATFNKAIAMNPRSPLSKFHRGSMYFALGRHAEALKELEELKEIIPKESLVYYMIGKVHKKLGNTDQALMHFSWATDLDPKGASSQISQAFDPSAGRTPGAEIDSPASPEESRSARVSLPTPERLNFEALPDDSEDSF